MLTRRGLVGGLVGLIAAPAIVPIKSLMAMPRARWLNHRSLWNASCEMQGSAGYALRHSPLIDGNKFVFDSIGDDVVADRFAIMLDGHVVYIHDASLLLNDGDTVTLRVGNLELS